MEQARLRTWRPEDARTVWRLANNRKIWRNLRDGFPHPYSQADAEAFIATALTRDPETMLCIDVAGQAVGSIGLAPGQDVERFGAELGYWLGEPFWGRGISTAAVEAMCAYGFETLGLKRVCAMPYAWNPASCRVLQKAGFSQEGRLRSSVFKDGLWVDQLLYARLADD